MRRQRANVKQLALAVALMIFCVFAPMHSPAKANQSITVSSATTPTGLTAPSPFSPSTNSMQLFITAPTSDGGLGIEEMEFRAYPGAIATSIFTNVLANWESLNLNPGTTYSFTVRFRNAAGWSEESPRSVSISTLAVPAASPTPGANQPASEPNPTPVLELKPLPMQITPGCLTAGTTAVVTLQGERLDGVLSASVAGLAIGLSKVSANSIDLAIPALEPGTYDITYVSANGLVFQQSALRVCAASTISPVTTVSPTVSPSTSPTSSPSTSPEQALVREDLTVFFAADSSRLNATSRNSLANLAQQHIQMQSSFIVVDGFARSLTNPSYARSLATRRAQAVISFLRSQGLEVFFRLETTTNSVGSPAQNRKAVISITSRPHVNRP